MALKIVKRKSVLVYGYSVWVLKDSKTGHYYQAGIGERMEFHKKKEALKYLKQLNKIWKKRGKHDRKNI